MTPTQNPRRLRFTCAERTYADDAARSAGLSLCDWIRARIRDRIQGEDGETRRAVPPDGPAGAPFVLRFPSEDVAQIHARRGGIPFTTWVKEACLQVPVRQEAAYDSRSRSNSTGS